MAFWKKLGKGLLKAAPIAASFIPGIGPLAAMGIGAATGGLSGALGGGGKKGALLGAGLGAGTTGLGMGVKSALTPFKGPVGPTQGFMSKMFGAAKPAAKMVGMMGKGMQGGPVERAPYSMTGYGGGQFGYGNSPYRTPPFFPQNTGMKRQSIFSQIKKNQSKPKPFVSL